MNSLDRRYVLTLGGFIAMVAAALAVTSAAADSMSDDQAAIQAAVDHWAAASQARDLEAFVSVYAPDAVIMLEGAPDLKGLEAIREGIGGMMQDPNFNLWFEADRIVVSGSGDMAHESGTFSLSVSDPEGQPVTQQGHYVVVWEKRDGQWKVVFDVPVSDPPETAPSD